MKRMIVLSVCLVAFSTFSSILSSSDIDHYVTMTNFFPKVVPSSETPGSDNFAYYHTNRPITAVAGSSFYATLGAYEERRKIVCDMTDEPIMATNRVIQLLLRLKTIMQTLSENITEPFHEDGDYYRWTSNPRLADYSRHTWSGCDWSSDPLSGLAPVFWLPSFGGLRNGSYIKADKYYDRSPALTYLMFVTQNDMSPNTVTVAYDNGSDKFPLPLKTDDCMRYLFPSNCTCSDIANTNWRVICTSNITITAQCVGAQSVIHEEPDGYMGATNRVNYSGNGTHSVTNREVGLSCVVVTQQIEPVPRVRVTCSNDAVIAVGPPRDYTGNMTTWSEQTEPAPPYAYLYASMSSYNVTCRAPVGTFTILANSGCEALTSAGLTSPPDTYIFIFTGTIDGRGDTDYAEANVYENEDTNNPPTKVSVAVRSFTGLNGNDSNYVFTCDASCTTSRSGDYCLDGEVGEPIEYGNLGVSKTFTSFSSMCVYSNENLKSYYYRAIPYSTDLLTAVRNDNAAFAAKIRTELEPICGGDFDNPTAFLANKQRFNEMMDACKNTGNRFCGRSFRFDTGKINRIVKAGTIYEWERSEPSGEVYAEVRDNLAKEVSPSCATSSERRWLQTSKINYDCLTDNG